MDDLTLQQQFEIALGEYNIAYAQWAQAICGRWTKGMGITIREYDRRLDAAEITLKETFARLTVEERDALMAGE